MASPASREGQRPEIPCHDGEARAPTARERRRTIAASRPGSATADAAPEPGTKSVAPGVPVQPGGDNSIQTFGVEGEVGQREQALATLRAYLNARVAGQWAKACAETSEEFKEQAAAAVDDGSAEGEARRLRCDA